MDLSRQKKAPANEQVQRNTGDSSVVLQGAARRTLLALAIFLLLPVIWGLCFTDAEKRSQFENRTLAPPPVISDFRNPTDFFPKLTMYVQDHIGFSVEVNRMYRKVAFFLFHQSTVQNISVADSGFVFLTSHLADQHNTVFEQMCQPNPSATQINNAFENLVAIKRSINAFGHRVIFATTMTKPTLYPEHIPREVRRETRDKCLSFSAENNLLKALKSKATKNDLIFHYPFAEFIAAKDEEFFWPKENFHWHGLSAHLFSKTLFNKLGLQAGSNFDKGKHLVTEEADLKMLGFTRNIAVWDFPYEDFGITGGFKDKTLEYMKAYYSRMIDYSYYATKKPLQDKHAIIISDSFGGSVARHLAPGYKSISHFNVSQLQPIEQKRFYRYLLNKSKGMDVIFMFHDGSIIYRGVLQSLAETFTHINEPAIITYFASQLPGLIGRAESSTRVARSQADAAGVLTFGPYISLAGGQYRITINYHGKAEENDIIGNWDIGRFDVSSIPIKAGEFESNGKNITTMVDISAGGIEQLEVRTFFKGYGELVIESIVIEESVGK